ncbi:MAG: hypothetical protein P1V51_03105 [Deltaproteobacteria bacterium]|nr:hypothetical protein [Deltaproteobacteria bacterium]
MLALVVVLAGLGCTDETLFTQGRIEDLCNGVVPSCKKQAGCVLDDEHFTRGVFPGEQRIVVRSITRDARLIVRLLFVEMVYPGTEILVQAFSPDCGDVSMEQVVVDGPEDIDLFEYAGDDRIIEFHLDLPEAGDHLLEIYSDMAADYLVTTEVEEE